ncbi:MAG: photosynthetic reaction center subunit H [Pseudomonadota bacterium]
MYDLGLSDHYDLGILTLYAFWVFFFLLVAYLNREGTREGFPVISETTGKPVPNALLPEPKEFKLQGGVSTFAPHPENYEEEVKADSAAPFGGAPLEPTGVPMLSNFGPGAYANRIDQPLRTHHGELKMRPMRDLDEFSIADGDRDPRGLPVYGADGEVAGSVLDVWIDQEEQMIRYLEVELPPAVEGGASKRVLLPINFAVVGGARRMFGVWKPEVRVNSILAMHFKYVPETKNPDEVTLLEEDKIVAFYGGGTLYATPARREPLL